MKISPAHVDIARVGRPSTSPTPPNDLGPPDRAAAERGVGARGDRVDIARGGLTPAERIDAFAAHVHERLAGFAELEGVDLSEVESAFDQHIARIQNALADGTIAIDELERVLGNTVDLLREGVRATIPHGEPDRGTDARGDGGPRVDDRAAVGDGRALGPPADAADGEEAVRAYADRLSARIEALLQDAGEGAVAEGLTGALTTFQEHVGRLLAGLADGSIGLDDVGRALRNAVDYATQNVQDALGLTDRTRADDSAEIQPIDERPAVGPAQERFEAFSARVLERLASLDASGLSPEDQATLAELTEAFASEASRLGSAFFEDHTLSRHDFQRLFQDTFRDLRGELASLFDAPDGPSGRGMQLYHPITGIEVLTAPGASLDAQA